MSWRIITDDWRLKLLAVGLAVLMLGAVAFSQNPPTTGSQTVQLGYVRVPANLILLNPPSSVPVTYTGTADEIQKAKNCSCFSATVDVSNARAGTNVLDVAAKSTIADLNVQDPFPITVTIDSYVQGKDLAVQVSAHAAAGWSITKTAAACPNTPCVVHFSGPASWLKNMTATVTYPTGVNLGSIDSPNQPVQLTNTNGLVDLTTCRTVPCATLDTLTASIHIEAVQGSNSSTITLLDSPPSHPPANGYRVTAVTITPNFVNISGDPTTIGRIRNITLPAVDLTGRTSDFTFPVTIPYPDGVSGSVSTATIKFSISPNPAVSPTP
ncbi:MAG TPA: CdaR family protein [Candidatus Dormibacteraeota bacterium]|nr:CdaR family protein [Candidatus Dormibacteraeota bacterium]